jgi:hypothetical protein
VTILSIKGKVSQRPPIQAGNEGVMKPTKKQPSRDNLAAAFQHRFLLSGKLHLSSLSMTVLIAPLTPISPFQ